LALITDEQFETFVEKTLLSGYAAKILKGLLPPPEPNAETEDAPNPESVRAITTSAESSSSARAAS
jgi:hypothetical protein